MDLRVLLVDDDERIRGILSDMMTEMGFIVKTAADPGAALLAAADESFQLALVDNYLGETEGVHLIAQLADVDPEIQCVIMTGSPNVDTAIHALKKGAVDFLRKPFRVEELLTAIDLVNRKRKLEQERKELLAGLELRIREKTDELKQVYLSVLVTLSRTVEKKDLGTYGHSMRVSHLAARIAESLGLSPAHVDDIRAAALLHDIGKIGISDGILGKQGPLTAEELRTIRSHPEKGVEILQPLKQFETLLPAILHHHERFDGSGYPKGLTGEAIPLSARIISVADTYDAILSDRPYRLAASHDKALREMQTWAERQFDSRVLDAFLGILQESTQPVPEERS